MYQIKIFDAQFVGELEVDVNMWLQEHRNIEIIDVETHVTPTLVVCVIKYRV